MAKKVDELIEQLKDEADIGSKLEKSVTKLAEAVVDSNEEMIATYVEGMKRLLKKDQIDPTPVLKQLIQAIDNQTSINKQHLNSLEKAFKGIKLPDNTTVIRILKNEIKNLRGDVKGLDFSLPTSPKNPIAVRMSDGDKWVETLKETSKSIQQLPGIITAGGGGKRSFQDASGNDGRAKLSADGYVIVVAKDGSDISGGGSATTYTLAGDGVTTVTTAGTDVVLASSTTCKRVTIQAQTDNTGIIAVGATGVDATEATGTGVILYPGDAYELDTDNLNTVYIDSSVNGEGVRYTYYT